MNGKAILQGLDSIVAQFRSMSNASGNRLLTNYENGLIGNRPVSFDMIVTVDKSEYKVSCQNYQPARDQTTGEIVKSLSSEVYDLYKAGMVGYSDKIVNLEALQLIGYFASCVVTGQLPTPSKRAGSSTVMSYYLDDIMRRYKIKVTSLNVSGMTISPKRLKSTLAIYNENAKDILDNWTLNVKKSASTTHAWKVI